MWPYPQSWFSIQTKAHLAFLIRIPILFTPLGLDSLLIHTLLFSLFLFFYFWSFLNLNMSLCFLQNGFSFVWNVINFFASLCMVFLKNRDYNGWIWDESSSSFHLSHLFKIISINVSLKICIFIYIYIYIYIYILRIEK